MFVTSSYQFYISFLFALVTHIDIRRQVTPSQMAYVDRTVGVGQRRSNQYSFIISHGRKDKDGNRQSAIGNNLKSFALNLFL
jgi:hypothetical protein